MFGLDRTQAMIALLRQASTHFGLECEGPESFQTAERQGLSPFAKLFGDHMERLERLCCARDGVPLFTPLAGEMMCRAVISCPDLHAVLERSCQFSSIIAGQQHGSMLIDEGEFVRFEFVSRYTTRDEASLLNDIIGLLYHISLISWLGGEPLEPESVVLAYRQPERSHPVFAIFHGTIRFDSHRTALLFRKTALARPVIRRPEEIDSIIAYFPHSFIVRAMGHRELAEQVKLLMDKALRQGQAIPTECAIAAALTMSGATLRRRLHRQGTSYRELRAFSLREEAERLMQNRDLALAAIAQRLGFSDDRAFRRAFKAWTGMNPSALPTRAMPQAGPQSPKG